LEGITISQEYGSFEAMRVVHITPYFPPCKGGIARFVSGLVESTKNVGSVHVITKEGEPEENVSVLSSGKGIFILKALQILRKLEPDVIHEVAQGR
jgi:hypothetical protein